MRKLTLTRDVPQSECPWLEVNLKAGMEFCEFTGCTYGCVSPSGIAATWMPDQTPFFELPRDAVAELREITLEDACKALLGLIDLPDTWDNSPSEKTLKRRKREAAAARKISRPLRVKKDADVTLETGLF